MKNTLNSIYDIHSFILESLLIDCEYKLRHANVLYPITAHFIHNIKFNINLISSYNITILLSLKLQVLVEEHLVA